MYKLIEQYFTMFYVRAVVYRDVCIITAINIYNLAIVFPNSLLHKMTIALSSSSLLNVSCSINKLVKHNNL